MEYIAQRGHDVYMVDVRGYGRSTRPPEMSQPPKANGAIVTTDVAIRDVGRAVDFILRRRGVDRTCERRWRKGCSPT
jgi:alpha-beta hydrolase superfamily lysophospholipase